MMTSLAQKTGQGSAGRSVESLGRPSQLSPGAEYREAIRPVEITRRPLSNWSQIEQASLVVAIRQAGAACVARRYDAYTGNDLADFVRLCALGQSWQIVATAADRYFRDKGNGERTAEVYAEKIDADLHLKQEVSLLRDTKAMLNAVPYSSTVADASDEALSSMELLYTEDALALADMRQKLIMQALHKEIETRPTSQGADSQRVAVHDLYSQGLRLAVLQQFTGNLDGAQQTQDSLDAAVSSGLSSDEKTHIAASRRKYMQLGQPLGPLKLSYSLDLTGRLPDIPANRAVTVLVVFPDWCVQCIRLVQRMPDTVFTVEQHEAYAYGLLVQTVPPDKSLKQGVTPQQGSDDFNPALAATYLHGTSTVIVPPQIFDRFNATDFPVLIATDGRGIVRYIGTADATALEPGQLLESLVAVISKRWPTTTLFNSPVRQIE